LRGLTLEETAPTDEELADDTPPPEIDYAAGDPPDDPPGDAPTVHTGGDDGSEPDDEFSAFDNMSLEEKKHYTIEKYGFTWGEKPTTPEEIAGHKRYTADRQRATAELNKRIDELLNGRSRKIRAAVKKRKATIARKRREEAAQAARAAREAEREARRKVQEAKRKERETERQAAREAKAAKLEAERRERAAFKARARELGIPLQKARWTPKHQRIWDRALRREEKAKIEAERAAKRAARQGEQTAAFATSEERQKALEEKRRIVLEKYGFTLGKKPTTPEEIEGRKRYYRDKEAEERKRRHDQITEYNREYRRRKRAAALAAAQTKWTSEQWAEWQKRQEAKERGTPQWLLREVVNHLALENDIAEDAVLDRLMELDGLDFLLKGAESLGAAKCARPAFVIAAVRALALYLDPDKAAMFGQGGS